MPKAPARKYLRHQLEAHMTELGYSHDRVMKPTTPAAEIARINPTRGRIAYGQTVSHADLRLRSCHERLLYFSQRRTRRRSSILFFIGVAETDEEKLEALLEQLEIRSRQRGGHVHIVPIPAPQQARK